MTKTRTDAKVNSKSGLSICPTFSEERESVFISLTDQLKLHKSSDVKPYTVEYVYADKVVLHKNIGLYSWCHLVPEPTYIFQFSAYMEKRNTRTGLTGMCRQLHSLHIYWHFHIWSVKVLSVVHIHHVFHFFIITCRRLIMRPYIESSQIFIVMTVPARSGIISRSECPGNINVQWDKIIDLFVVLRHSKEYFPHMTAASNMLILSRA